MTPGEQDTPRRPRVSFREYNPVTPATPRDHQEPPLPVAKEQDTHTPTRLEFVEETPVYHHPVDIDMDGSENAEALRVRTPAASTPHLLVDHVEPQGDSCRQGTKALTWSRMSSLVGS